MAKKDTTKLKDLLKRQKSSNDFEELELLEILIDKETDKLKLKRNYSKGGSIAKMNKGKQPKSYAQDTTPPSPYVATPDGYMVLKEKSVNIPIPKSKPKAQRKKAGGKIGSGNNRLY